MSAMDLVWDGLKEAIRILTDVKGIGFVELSEKDVVRHKLVREIIDAYQRDAKPEEGPKT